MNLFSLLFLAMAPIMVVSSNIWIDRHDTCGIMESVNIIPSITLNTTNSLLLKGEVNRESVNKFLVDLHRLENKQNLYLFLDTNGGSVEDGNKIVSEVVKYGISCIAERAYSMGFVILQACKNRYITPFGRIMQHQISYGVANEKAKVESYVEFIKQVEETLAIMQSKKIGIDLDDFRRKTYNDWWMFGEYAVQANCADNVVDVSCSPKLSRSTYVKTEFFIDYVYSACPLIPDPLEVKKSRRG